MSDRATLDLLASVPLFEGRTEAELEELARCARPRTVKAATCSGSQGDHPRELVLIVDGTVSASVQVTGGRAVEIGTSGRGEIVGLIGLLDGGGHATTVRVTETTTVLALGRLDFAALLAGRTPRRSGSAATSRGSSPRASAARSSTSPSRSAAACRARRSGRPRRASTASRRRARPTAATSGAWHSFHAFDPLALWGFLTSGRYVRCPPGRTLLTEGTPSPRLLPDDQRRRREGARPRRPADPRRARGAGAGVRLRGPDRGRPSNVTAIARERALLLVVPRDLFARLFDGEDAGLARLPGRDPERADGHAAGDPAPGRPPRRDGLIPVGSHAVATPG